jgi:FHS family L-fucose permease-like MFS transporter
LQVAATPYISLLGSERTASSRLNLAQAFNSLGTTLAPKFGGLVILSGTVLTAAELAKLPAARQLSYRAGQAHAVQGPYIGLAIVLFVLAAIVFLSHLPAPPAEEDETHAATFRAALRHRHVLFGVIGIFVYVGAEVSIGSFMINYISLPDIGHMSESHAANYVALYWGGAMIGRFVGSAILQKIDPRKLLGIFAVIAALLVLTTMLTQGSIALWTIVAIGLFNSIMFPTIFTLGIERMGVLTGKASSLLIMAIVGGAIIPLCQGALADTIGVHHAFVLPLACYLYIMFYGFKGSKIITVHG